MKNQKFTHNMTDKIKNAHEFAAQAHYSDLTPGTSHSYMVHLVNTAELAMNHGLTETQLCACLLKDTMKMTNARLDQLKELFGIKVSELVKELSMAQEWHKITNICVPVIRCAESIDLLSRLDSGRLGEEYREGVLLQANTLITELEPLVQVMGMMDQDLSIKDILKELEEAYEKVGENNE